MLNPNDIPDHPIVRSLMSTGYPDGNEPTEYRCPFCGEECNFYYVDSQDVVVGCENCIRATDPEDWLNEDL